MSLKQKYPLEEFPLLGGRKHLNDGFGHIVEEREEKEDDLDATVVDNNDKDARIAALEAQLSDHNHVKEQLIQVKSKLDSVRKRTKPDPEADKVVKLVIQSEALEYDPANDKVVTKNEEVLNRLVDENCKSKDDRENKKH